MRELRRAKLHEWFFPAASCLARCSIKMIFQSPIRTRGRAVIADVEEVLSRALLHFTSQVRQNVEAINVDRVGFVADLYPLSSFWLTFGSPAAARSVGTYLVSYDVVEDGTGLEFSGPAHHAGNPPSAFPVRVFLGAERCHPAIGPGVEMRSVIG